MLFFIFGLLLVLVGVILWALLRTYEHVPVHELKRLARDGDDAARLLYRVASYGSSLRALLGGGIVLLLSLALGCMVQAFGVFVGVATFLVALGLGNFIFVPSGQLTSGSLALAKGVAPVIARILERLQPAMGGVVRFVRKHRHVSVHTGVFEKSDLFELLERQRGQVDNRIDPNDISLLEHVLTFGDRLVTDVLTPKRVVKTVATTDSIGPLLMDELARSGHSRFPVYGESRDNIVGILYLHDLVGTRSTGTVAEVMKHKLTYVHEDFTLRQALQAFLKTKQHLFLVVNGFEELVGIVTIEDVLEQIIGKQIVDEFDQYDDLRAVAETAAKKDHRAHPEPKPEPQATTEPSEVVQ